MAISQIELPFDKKALEPHMSSETLDYHYGKHHAGYVKKVNKALEKDAADMQGKSLVELVKNAEGGLFNNAAQVWNHDFFWQSLCPEDSQVEPSAPLANAIATKFGSVEEFQEAFSDTAKSNFGSGWTWLVCDSSGEVSIINTSNAETPVADDNYTPLLTLDVWEHAYYVDYRNARGKYISAFWKICNWKFASDNYAAAVS